MGGGYSLVAVRSFVRVWVWVSLCECCCAVRVAGRGVRGSDERECADRGRASEREREEVARRESVDLRSQRVPRTQASHQPSQHESKWEAVSSANTKAAPRSRLVILNERLATANTTTTSEYKLNTNCLVISLPSLPPLPCSLCSVSSRLSAHGHRSHFSDQPLQAARSPTPPHQLVSFEPELPVDRPARREQPTSMRASESEGSPGIGDCSERTRAISVFREDGLARRGFEEEEREASSDASIALSAVRSVSFDVLRRCTTPDEPVLPSRTVFALVEPCFSAPALSRARLAPANLAVGASARSHDLSDP